VDGGLCRALDYLWNTRVWARVHKDLGYLGLETLVGKTCQILLKIDMRIDIMWSYPEYEYYHILPITEPTITDSLESR
jgi:hypothetical protein